MIHQTNCGKRYPIVCLNASVDVLLLQYYSVNRDQPWLDRFFSKRKVMHLPVRAGIIADRSLSINDPVLIQAVDSYLAARETQFSSIMNPMVPPINYQPLLQQLPPNWAFESTIANDKITVVGNIDPMSLNGCHFPVAPRDQLEVKVVIIDSARSLNFDVIAAFLAEKGLSDLLIDRLGKVYRRTYKSEVYYRDAVYNEVPFGH